METISNKSDWVLFKLKIRLILVFHMLKLACSSSNVVKLFFFASAKKMD